LDLNYWKMRINDPCNCFQDSSIISPLIHAGSIKERLSQIADEIVSKTNSYPYINLIPLLTGGMFFCVDLAMALEERISGKWIINPLMVSAYGMHDKITKEPTIIASPDFAHKMNFNCPSIIVDDLADTGSSIDMVIQYLKALHFRHQTNEKIWTAVLINKTKFRTFDLAIDFRCFNYQDGNWLIGYGMDDKGIYRGSKCIGSRLPVG